MASVLFIIRVPFETKKDDSQSLKEQIVDKEQKSEISVQEVDLSQDTERNEIFHDARDQTVKEKELTKSSDYPPSPSQDDDIEFAKPLSIVEILQNVLELLKVHGQSWQVTKDKQFHQVIFLEQVGKRVESILKMLTDAGIGIRPKSSVSVIPTSVHIQTHKQVIPNEQRTSKGENDSNIQEETDPLITEPKESSKDVFIKSIKSRLTVEQVVEGVRMQARLTFDFVMFTILASLIAAVGLVENNSVVLVASMLVSPLMGPILGGTFGTVIKNRELRNTGLKTEICGLTISVFVGFLFGFVCGPFGLDGASWDTNQDSWPTKEMTSRGMLRGLWVGALIALPSGAGVALSVLGGNASPLVGVAISASLLPPAVNSGMLWAYSLICAIKHPTFSELPLETNASQAVGDLDCRALRGNRYTPIYSCNMAEEAAIMAIINLVLTIVNIICILITATLVLKFKEVVPRASSSNATQTFWTKDVKVAREAYQTLHGNEAMNLKTTFLKEWKKVCRNSDEPQSPLQNQAQFLDIIQGVEEDQAFQTVVARAPQGTQYLHQYSSELKDQISVEEERKADVDEELMALFHLWTVHNQYTAHNRTGLRQRHVETLFEESPSEPEVKTKPKPKKEGREFFVTDIDKPHHTSVVRVRPPSGAFEKYSVSTESGV